MAVWCCRRWCSGLKAGSYFKNLSMSTSRRKNKQIVKAKFKTAELHCQNLNSSKLMLIMPS